jgi:hypothetical protein
MKRLHEPILRAVLALLVLGLCNATRAQDDSTGKKTLILTPGYYVVNNQGQYVVVKAKTTIDRKFVPVDNLKLSVFLDGADIRNLLGRVLTDPNGEARLAIPPSMQADWAGSIAHTLTAVSEANKDFDETRAEASFTRGRILIDTAEGRSLQVTVSQMNDKREWVPVKGVEMKIGVRRQASLLPISADDATYTTDSLGQVTAEFKRDSLAADAKNDLVVAAVVEDNETLGNLSIEKTIPWGKYVKPVSNFDQRTLYATRQKTPLWLMFMAYSIIIAVWGTIIYLIRGVFRIKKIGMS